MTFSEKKFWIIYIHTLSFNWEALHGAALNQDGYLIRTSPREPV